MSLLKIVAPIFLVLAHLIGYRTNLKSKQRIGFIKSFSAGFSISYVLLLLLPEVERSGVATSIQTSILVLAGFIFFHSSLRFVFTYQNLQHKTLAVDMIHLTAIGLYNFLITFLAIELIQIREKEGVIIFAIVIVHTILSEMTHDKANSLKLEKAKLPIIILTTVLAGAIALVFDISLFLRTTIFAFTAGSIFYISVREEMPKDSESKPLFFLIGAFCFLLIFAYL